MSDERLREQFEEAIRSRYGHASMSFERDGVGGYVNRIVHDHWEGWQAREAVIEDLNQSLSDLGAAFDQIASAAKPYADLAHKLMKRARGEANAD